MLKKLIMAVATALSMTSCNNEKWIKEEGKVHGTLYHLTYLSPDGKSLRAEYEKEFNEFDMSLSTFKDNSIISRINKNDTTVEVDSLFRTVFEESIRISEATDGAFDITVAPLVNAWGFGFDSKDDITEKQIEEILSHVGYKKVRLEGNKLRKDDPQIMLDASAIAKGYSSDVVAQLLEKNGVKRYLVEIGGECTIKGMNPNGQRWSIGITKPVDDSTQQQNELQSIVELTDCGMATSGNYRQFYYKDGKKYAHTINPKDGHPVNHSLLSATIVANNCMEADALATACMVMGQEKALETIEKMQGVECYLICSGDSGEYKTIWSSGFEKMLKK